MNSSHARRKIMCQGVTVELFLVTGRYWAGRRSTLGHVLVSDSGCTLLQTSLSGSAQWRVSLLSCNPFRLKTEIDHQLHCVTDVCFDVFSTIEDSIGLSLFVIFRLVCLTYFVSPFSRCAWEATLEMAVILLVTLCFFLSREHFNFLRVQLFLVWNVLFRQLSGICVKLRRRIRVGSQYFCSWRKCTTNSLELAIISCTSWKWAKYMTRRCPRTKTSATAWKTETFTPVSWTTCGYVDLLDDF